MSIRKIYKVIGIMSGTSMDGLDCSYVETDGENYISIIDEKSYEYSSWYKNKLKKIVNYYNVNRQRIKTKQYENIITQQFIKIIKKFIKEFKINKSSLNFIGISGQTVLHIPQKKISIQLGSCKVMQKELNITVIGNFRDNDIKKGGEGAPIGAFYHKYLIDNIFPSSAIINLGGIANISFVKNKKIIAFDVGPANALIDDLMLHFYNQYYDDGGKKASKGKIDKKLISEFKKDQFFKKKFPKSLDRQNFKTYFNKLIKLKKNDAIHTASIMTIESIMIGLNLINKKIKLIILTGGGRKNSFIVSKLKKRLKKLDTKLNLIESYNYNGDFLEAQAFAYIAVRCLKKLPLSIPTTTGVKSPTTGGKIYR